MSHRKLFDSNKLSKFYASTRPTPPKELIDEIVKNCGQTDVCVDVGCGTGQVTSLLVPHFKKVIGIDASITQLKEAEDANKYQNVEYQVGVSEGMKLEDASADLVSVSQALHWFNIEASLKEFKRVLKPDGLLAVITYMMPKMVSSSGHDVDEDFVRQKVYKHESFKKYWNWKERSFIDNCYENINFDQFFNNVERHKCDYVTRVKLDSQRSFVLNNLNSWSPFQTLMDTSEKEANELISNLLKMIPKDDDENRNLYLEYPYTLILCKK